MPTEPEIKVLPYEKRRSFFLVLFLIFIITLPVFIFYTSGYRLSFDNQETNIVTTGGMYITTDNLEVDVYLNEEQVQRPRLFRSAYYIQNIETGLHRVVVQQPGLHTWVKLLPVDSYIVTEAAAFNMPVVPHIRPISEYKTTLGQSVYAAKSTSTQLFPKASTTENLLLVSKLATSTLVHNEEYDYVSSLFATTTATSSATILSRLEGEIERFKFSTTTEGESSSTVPVTYVEQGNMRLVQQGEDLYAVWIGSANSIPHYFCAGNSAASTTIATRFGDHFAAQIEAQRISTSTPLVFDGGRVCRTEIRIDRKWQTIKYYDFLPGSSDLIMLQLGDGLYVTEIDDRSWQNTQLVYPGDNFFTSVTDNNIYLKEDGRYFELITKLETN